MKIPKRGEKGFTLVELLIVLAILAVLAAVVIPNVTGMMGRGATQAFDTDEETLQMACATFYFDTHVGDAGSNWNAVGEPGHKYPTASGQPADVEPSQYAATGSLTLIPDADLETGVIWMGLLVNVAAAAEEAAANAITAHPLIYTPDGATEPVTERGPYLNEIPKSAGPDNGGIEGTYIWICGKSGNIFAVSLKDGLYYAGFGETYP